MSQSRPKFRPPPPPPPSLHSSTPSLVPPSPRAKFSIGNESLRSDSYRPKKRPPLPPLSLPRANSAQLHTSGRPINLNNTCSSINNSSYFNGHNISQIHSVVKKPLNKAHSASRLSFPKFFNSIGTKMANLLPPSSASQYQLKQQQQQHHQPQNHSLRSSAASHKPSRAPPPPPLMMNQSQHCVPIVVQKNRTPPPPSTPLSTGRMMNLTFPRSVPPPPQLSHSKTTPSQTLIIESAPIVKVATTIPKAPPLPPSNFHMNASKVNVSANPPIASTTATFKLKTSKVAPTSPLPPASFNLNKSKPNNSFDVEEQRKKNSTNVHETLMDDIRSGVRLKQLNGSEQKREKIVRKTSLNEESGRFDVLMEEIRRGVKLRPVKTGEKRKPPSGQHRKICSPPPCVHDLLMNNIRAGVSLRQIGSSTNEENKD